MTALKLTFNFFMMRFDPDEQISIQKVCAEELVKMAGKYKNFVVLEANVGAGSGLQNFARQFPDRYFKFGNSVRVMIAAAAGFVARGKIPLLFAYAIPATGTAWDSIRNFICAQNLNVKIFGLHAGILNAEEGVPNQALEDVAIMRSVPNMKVVAPADAAETRQALDVMMLDYGPCYMRLMHLPLPKLYTEKHKFVFGKGDIYKSGTDVCIFSYGTTMHTSLDAAEILERKKISTMVVNMSSLAPVDDSLIVECAKAVDKIVTVEDHQISGGLGTAVCEILSTDYPSKVLRLGMDGYAESGKVDDLYKKFRLDGMGIAEQIEDWIKT